MDSPTSPPELEVGGTTPQVSPSNFVLQERPPRQIGRYRVISVLGEGGFGRVYLAHDDQLDRSVAIKVPRRDRISRPEDAEAYLAEARVLASLDQPHIVPVHDVGTTEDGLCYVVSKLIEGSDLAHKIKQGRLSLRQAAELTATAAGALHYAHRKGLVHRDIKPANILIDTADKPYIADFGLALKEQDLGKGAGFAGTPAYMSPEQARGEGHRVDGRSDVFSLGVVFYELLTGRRPFKGDTQSELLEQITTLEARPPRQYDDAIPKELERICLKSLAKRASERYSTAGDMADDLRHFLAETPSAPPVMARSPDRAITGGADVATPPVGARSPDRASLTPPASDSHPVKVVPKGLRSFDAGDADFFLNLLPGARDREGLPDSIRFWKSRIETTDTDAAFSVGLIYGPSGCGKSSLVKAGLLPRLAKSVLPAYLEATADETEARLLKSVRRQAPDLPNHFGLVESLAALRQGRFLKSGQKVLIVLDQFEQWLHAKRNGENTQLVKALRHCDGTRLQAVVMVRDDFWLAVSRFMQALEIRVVEGENSRLVDLFDPRHARKVLTSFGRALGALPDEKLSKEQDAFLDQAVVGLAQEGNVISVRLALFAEMVKGKPWTPAALKAVGGAEGVGVAFLDETFTATTAPPQHRLHQKAAQAVLRALLPEAGTDIKGHMRSRNELLEASGYGNRPRDFDELLPILDSEIRLITPTDPEGNAAADTASIEAGAQYYQLTHDYLVPWLRGWLTRKHKETRRGRAELLLTDRSAVWNARPENRQLPSLWQWCRIRWLTAKKKWTLPQRKMMGKAGQYHTVRGLTAAVFLFLLCWGVYEAHGRLQAHALRDRLLDANTADVPTVVRDMGPYRGWLDPLLRDAAAAAETNKDAPKQLRARLALLPADAGQVDYLYGRLLDAEPNEVLVIRDALAPHKDALLDKLWTVAAAPEKGKESQRLRAAVALAMYDPERPQWDKVQDAVANDLVGVPAVHLAMWMDGLRPVKDKLLAPLKNVYCNAKRGETERFLATDILADYASDNPQDLANLLMDGEAKQFVVIYPKFKEQGEKGLPLLTGEIDKTLPADLPSSDPNREILAKRQANAAVALLRMNQPAQVWPLLKHSPDPRVRSYLIDRLSPLGADPEAIVKRLEEEPDVTVRRALLLSLGEFDEKQLPADERTRLSPKVQEIYSTAPDPGLHAAAEWLLRTWKQEAWLKQVNNEWAKDKELRDKASRAAFGPGAAPQWCVNGQGQTMVIIPQPKQPFLMGSPKTETGRQDYEYQHKVRIGRTFAVAAKSVTLEQYRKFDDGYKLPAVYTSMADLPVVGISWFMAAEYCNWLSKKEGIAEEQWCYEIQGIETKLKAKYLSLSGYRLPTEAEMEYATRAGATTARYYGETEDLLPMYAWYTKNAQEKTWPVGGKKPNDFGLFDAQGNVFTWCLERYESYPEENNGEAIDDKEDSLTIDIAKGRIMRGGSYNVRASDVRSADRFLYVPANRYLSRGLRPARTFTP